MVEAVVISFSICLIVSDVLRTAQEAIAQKWQAAMRCWARSNHRRRFSTIWFTLAANAWYSYYLLRYLATTIGFGVVLVYLSYLIGISPIFILLLMAITEVVSEKQQIYGTS